MGILLAGSSLGSKILIGFIIFVFIYGICLGPKGKSGSSKGGNSKKGNTKDLRFNPANTMQGHNRKRK